MIKVTIDRSELKKITNISSDYVAELSSIAINECVIFETDLANVWFRSFKKDILDKYNINYKVETL